MSTFGERPAFPVQATSLEHGITIRDWFAAMALQGVVAKGLDVIGDRVVSEQDRNLMLARRAYGLADAMLSLAEARDVAHAK
jgi:hypothetical protein